MIAARWICSSSGKRVYRSQYEARSVIPATRQVAGMVPVRAYLCTGCGGWHTTSTAYR